VSTEADRDDRPPEGQAAEEPEAVAPAAADPVAADPPVGDPDVGDPVAVNPFAADTEVAEPEPTPVIPVSESSFRQPPGTALPSVEPADPGDLASRPEVLAGAAFAGGLVVAMLVRRALN
jgi:hypothetical protein